MAEDESFKVTDRRGRSREESEETSSADPSTSLAGPPPPRADPNSAFPPDAASRGPHLQSLFVMFASSALISLGDAADPSTGERHVDLDQARDAIDMLALLRDKTAGNRTAAEDRLLEQIMYDLQMRFVRATESGRPG
jgi:Domain of unknown function (DUF1844)